jgi:cation transport regulator ChaB
MAKIKMMRKKDLPGAIRRSPRKVRKAYVKALDSAHDQSDGDKKRAHREALASLEDGFQKVGDHWEKTPDGASPPRTTKRARTTKGRKATGVDGQTKDELYQRAVKLGVKGRSKMNKRQLAQAVARKQKTTA